MVGRRCSGTSWPTATTTWWRSTATARSLGYAGLAVAPPDEAWVQNIAVRRDAQRRGIGRALLEALLAEADRHGARKVLLEVAVDNEAAQKLYAGYGFEADRRPPGLLPAEQHRRPGDDGVTS